MTIQNAAQWWVVYVDSVPLACSVGMNPDSVVTNMRAQAIGQFPETAVLKAVSVYDAPVDDVIRAFLPSLMMLLTGLTQAQSRGLRH